MKAIRDAISRGRLAMAGGRSPWGGSDGEPQGETGESQGDQPRADDPRPVPPPTTRPGPRNPWLPGGTDGPRKPAGIEDIFRTRPGGPGRPGGGGAGGPGGGFPRFPTRPDGRSWFPLIAGGIALMWLALSTTHMVGPKEQGIVTTLGKYSRTIGPGVSLTAPWPIENVSVVDVTSIKRDSIPEGEDEKLMLTSDRNLVDISYLVR
ncbi:MAG: SPFH domain-containing protein, partial [Pseudomonadota bacterium]